MQAAIDFALAAGHIHMMGRTISIIAAALIIAAAMVFTQRWEIAAVSGAVYRLDRWNGTITHCDDDWVQVKPNPGGPIRVDCTSK
jgi:hypothetical protein